jgi:hypothetical protein
LAPSLPPSISHKHTQAHTPISWIHPILFVQV